MSKFIAIDLDGQGIFAVAGTARGGSAKVDQAVAWTGAEADGGPPPFNPETARRIGEQLRERLRAAGFGSAPVLVSVPRDRVVLKELKYPAVPPADEPNVVRFQAIKELSDAPEDVVLDYVPLSNGAAAGERRSMAVVIRKDLHHAVQQLCAAANLRLVAVTPRPYAVAAAVGRELAASGGPEAAAEAVAVLTPGPGGGEFTVARGGEVVFTRTVPAPVVGSEPLLLAEVRRNLTMYAGANPGHPVRALYVAEADDRWAERLGAALGISVLAYDPLGASAPSVPEAVRGRFAGAAGLLAARAAGDPPINFASPRQPKAEADPKRTQLLLAALAAIVLLGGGAVLGWFVLDAADNEYAAKVGQRDRLKTEWQAAEPDQKRRAAAEAWVSRRVVWLDELYDMADRFPASNGTHAVSFTGQALPPDAKTGKQENQGKIELKVSSKEPQPLNDLRDQIERDAVDPNPGPKEKTPQKFYVAPDKSIRTQPDGTYGATVTTRLNGRLPDKFTRLPVGYSPPNRRYYPPAPAKEPEAKKDEKKPDEKKPEAKEAPAPAPRAKDTTGAE